MRARAIRASAIFAVFAAPAPLAVLLAAPFLALPIPAQTTPAPAPTAGPIHPRRSPVKTSAVKPAQPSAPVQPLAPKPPEWPANAPASEATVVWDSHGLRIQAANSSLQQILDQVATETGAKVEGLEGDQRIFGTYGPGDARDVLAQLLDGTGYNLLMVGGQESGAPLQVVLSARPTGPAPPVAETTSSDAAENDTAPEDQPQPPPIPMPRPAQNAFAPNQQPRTPQEIMQEMQQHQQQAQHSSPF